MFWRSVVGKLWITFLLLVSVVLAILSFLLLEFFENFNISEAENNLMQTATKISVMIEQDHDQELIIETAERIIDDNSKLFIVFNEQDVWLSETTDNSLEDISLDVLYNDADLAKVLDNQVEVKKEMEPLNNQAEYLIVGKPVEGTTSAVFVYQSLQVVNETTQQTTQIIFLSAGIAIILTTIFAFFLSTRITSPLIKMREGAIELANGEFHTKVPILTHDEIGELAMAFNRMGRQLKYHINALQQEKEQLYSILRSMADGVMTLNRNAEVIISNPPAEKFLEDSSFELEGKENNLKQLPEGIKEQFNQVIQTEKETSSEFFIQGRNWVVIMSPLYDQSYVRGVVAIIRDMTEERKMDQLREDFIANVSHELRTPISMLQGYSEAIMDDIAETKEDKNDLAKIINEESLRIGRLVNELLDLARMKAGHNNLTIEEINLDQFMRRIIRKFQGLANDKNISLQVDDHSDIKSFHGDSDRLEQVLTNLIDNAIKHTQDNGVVLVTIDKVSSSIQFSVKDNGEGIKTEDLPFVFERFYKADKSRKRQKGKKGTGLGLSIAKNIVEAHDGNISVRSKLQEGTTFIFHIPVENINFDKEENTR
ncbi:ATP-binding protein [Saliterribacillus persicus]|uniref:histidine kinase n=1 Tax=Saliterribacillus persicus TaxID=930114 RepID=A0A368XCC1_9BACI|nr:ATP-binding protein [Saliterribacillus persicus]RCW64876.1 PAS/PAC sensor signal transduction histidine kinase [Saliterribacillus persicus]